MTYALVLLGITAAIMALKIRGDTAYERRARRIFKLDKGE